MKEKGAPVGQTAVERGPSIESDCVYAFPNSVSFIIQWSMADQTGGLERMVGRGCRGRL